MVFTEMISSAGILYNNQRTLEYLARDADEYPLGFQLFGTKKDLFIAGTRLCFERTQRTFEQSGKTARDRGLGPVGILEEMGHAYIRLLMSDPNLLRLQLQAYAACQDAEIRAVVRESYRSLWRAVAAISGADDKEVQGWFAQGMLINVVSAIGRLTARGPSPVGYERMDTR